MAKKITERPDWLKAKNVIDVYSVSNCISEDFADYINDWKHNGYWLFDSPKIIEELAKSKSIKPASLKFFYYEVYEKQFDQDKGEWFPFSPDSSFKTRVIVPEKKHIEGYDVVTYSCGSSAECSPLSCNTLAESIKVNDHCLFASFEEAKFSIETNLFSNCEPGPFRIIAVYTVSQGLTGRAQ